MSARTTILRAPSALVWVIAEPDEHVEDLLADLAVSGLAARRLTLAAIGPRESVPSIALVVGSSGRPRASARCACAALRADPVLRHVPIILVMPAGRIPLADSEVDAHELLVRPLRAGELLARIGRAMASTPIRASAMLVLRAGGLRLDPNSRSIGVGEHSVALSGRGFELLHYLACDPGRVYSRPHLLRTVWHGEPDVGVRAVDIQVRRVRARLGDDLSLCIRTVRSVGYAFDEIAARAALRSGHRGGAEEPVRDSSVTPENLLEIVEQA